MMGHKKKGSESSPMKAQMEAGSGDKEEEQDLRHDSEYTSWEEIVQSDAEEEDVEEWSMEEGVNEFMATEQVDEETLNLAAGLASRSSGELEQALHQFLTLLATPKGSKVLLQYVLASPQCAELVSAWEAGAGATTTAVPLMLVLSQLLRHPVGKGQWTGGSGGDLVPKKHKGLMVVQARLDKLARSIVRTRMKDIYSHLSSSQRSRQKAALRLMASIVLRGRLLAVEVATTFDFTLQALRKIGKASRAPVNKGLSQGLLSQTMRSYFIEFALSFLVVGDPGLLRWVLQKRPLYASVLHGLASDDNSTIIEVLYVLQQKVLSDAALVPAGLQSALFGDVALEQLAQIVADDQLGDSKEVAYGMLMSLCTNPAHGLCPESASAWGPPPGAKTGAFGGGQGRLLRFMRRLQAIKVVQHREILLATARATPRLAAAYLDSVPFSVEPQPAPVWFVAMSIVVELISIASTPPPFPAMAQQGVPPPRMEGPLIQSSLRRLFPRALSKVTFNRGLQHASVLVRHGSLQVLLEALVSLERLLDAVTHAVDENLYKKIPAECSEMGFGDVLDWLVPESLSGQGSVVQETNVKKIQLRGSSDDVTSHNKEAESSGTVVDNLKGREVSRKQWLQLAESIQTTMWAALPDPNVLLLMLSMLRKVDTEVKSIAVKGCHKRSHVVDSDKPPSKRRRKEKGKGSVTHISSDSESDSSSSSIESEDQLDSEEMITLAQIWGEELIFGQQSHWRGDIECLLHAKILHVLAAYQRVLPVAFAEKGFDPFRLLPSSPADISRSQQEAILALLLATTGSPESFCIPWVHSSSSNMKAAGVTLSLIYKHAKPLLTLLVSLDSGKMRNQAYVVASCVLLSTGAFESNTHEVTLWLDHLLMLEGRRSSVHNSYSPENMDSEVRAPQFLGTVVGESVVEFLTRAVLDVGRGLYKYLDQLYSLLSAHTLKESSSDHYNQGPGITAPNFGPFVVCALEHTLRVARSAMPRPQQAAISLYVSGVLHHLLQTQVNAQALAVVITSLLSADLPLGKPSGAADPRSSQAEWLPLWALLMQAHTVLSLDKEDPIPLHIRLSETMMHHDGQLAAVIESCQKIEEEEEVGVTEKGLELASAILCALPQEVLKNFSSLVEMCAKVFMGNFPVLINVVVVYHGLLSEVVEQAIDQGLLLDTVATVMKRQKTEVISPVSISRKHSTSMDFFLQVLPFPVLFQAAVCSHAGKLLMSELMSSYLEDAATRIKVQDRPIAMRLILTWIHRLAALSPDGLDEQLHKCFGLLQYVVLLPKEWNMDGGGESDCSEHSNDERIMVCNNMVCESLAHSALSNSMQTGMWASSLNLQDPKRQRSRRALTHHTFHYLKSLIQMSTSWDPHGKSTAVSAKQLLQLQAKIATACRAYVGQAIAAVQMEELSGILNDFQFGNANSSASSSFLSSVVELAPYAEPQVLLHFLLLLFSRIGTSHPTEWLKFVNIFFSSFEAVLRVNGQKASVWSSEGKRMWTSASLVDRQSLLDIYRIVMKITLKEEDPLEAGGHCLLSALRLAPVAAMGLYSSQTVAAQLPQLISFTPVEVIHHCVRSPSKVRAEIALLLVQESQIHMAEFGRLLVAGTTDRGEVDGVSLVHVGLAGKFLTAAGDLSPMSKVPVLSDSDLLLLLPAAQAYLVRSLRGPANDMAHHVATAYWVLLTKHLRTWDKFVMEYLQESSCNVLEISGSSLGSAMQELVKMLQQCLGICNVSVKKQLALLHHLLPKDGIPLGFLDLKSPNYSEADLFMQLQKVYAKAAVVKVLLWNVLQVLRSDKKPEIQVEEEEEEKQKVAPLHTKKDKKRQATADVCTKYTSTIVTTLGMIFKQVTQEMGGASSCDSRLQMVSILEEYLLTQLSEIVQMLDVTQFQPTIILLLESFAKTALRFRFGKPMVMKALQALAMHLHHSAATQEHELGDVRDAAVHVLDLVIAHSQFVPLLLSCSSAPKKLPLNLGRHAGKGTVLSSLPSILSLIGSPLVVCLSNDDTSSSSSSGVTVQKDSRAPEASNNQSGDAGNDMELQLMEQRQFELVKLVKLLFQLKRHPDGALASPAELVTLEELLSLLLAAYSATSDRVDREILDLMHEVEKCGGPGFVGLAGMDYLWGEAALKRRARTKERKLLSDEEGTAVGQQETATEAWKRTFREDIAIDPRRCGLCVLGFPANSKHQWKVDVRSTGFETANKEFNKGSHGRVHDVEEQGLRAAAYDPAFILPFALHGISEGCINTEEFVHLGLLAVALVSISSSDDVLRKLGYEVLAGYLAALEDGPSFKGQPQIHLLLMYVKNTVTEIWQQLPYVLVLFAAEASCILMHPENPHYPIITRYLLRGPSMDLEYIPLFHSMFGSGSPRYRSERLWMLRLLGSGLASVHDARIYRRQFVLEILMSFYGSPLADTFTRKWVLQVLRKAARIGPCAQALVEHAGFLPWLVSTAVNLRESTTWELQDSKDASDMAAMVLETIENVLRWRFVEKRGLGEGMEELTTVALELHRFLTPHGDDTMPKLHAVFRRPTIRIITFVLRASQRRKTHQTHFTLTLSGLLEMIQWSEAEGVDTGYKVETTQETRALALLLLLHNSPPAVCTFKDKQLLYQIASWAVPVAIQMMSPDAHQEDFHRHIMGQAESGKNIDSICEKLLRWLVASLVLGKKAMEAKNRKRSAAATTMAPETPFTCWSVLMHDLSYQIVADSSASINWRLASLMVELQRLVPGDSSLGSLITALTALWPFNKLLSEQEAQQGEENWCVVVHLLQFLLSNLPVPQETNSLWRWSFNSPWRSNLNSEATKTTMNTPMQSSMFESEIRLSLLTVFQQLLLGGGGISCTHLADLVTHWKAGLANTVSNLGFETFDHQSRLEVTRDSAMDNFQRQIQEILQRHSY